jgi:nucleoside-diphosphate-sugar epimerase
MTQQKKFSCLRARESIGFECVNGLECGLKNSVKWFRKKKILK